MGSFFFSPLISGLVLNSDCSILDLQKYQMANIIVKSMIILNAHTSFGFARDVEIPWTAKISHLNFVPEGSECSFIISTYQGLSFTVGGLAADYFMKK